MPFALIRAVGQDEGLGLEQTDRGLEAIVDIGAFRDLDRGCVRALLFGETFRVCVPRQGK